MLIKFTCVKLDIMTHLAVFLLLFYVVQKPFKLWFGYSIIGTFLTKLNNMIRVDDNDFVNSVMKFDIRIL